MPITHDTNTKNAIATTVLTQLNSGTLVFLTQVDAVIATINLDNPAFSTPVAGESTLNNVPKTVTVSTTGTIAKFKLVDSTLTDRVFGTVSLPGNGGDIELTKLDYNIGDTFPIYSLTYRVPN